MQPVLPDPATQPQASLTVELEAFLGMNQIRRSLGRNVGLWIGTAVNDRFAVVQPGGTFTISENVKAMIAVSDGPLTVTVNSLALPMQSLMVLDVQTSGATTFHNAGSSIVNLAVDYLVP